VITPVEVWDMHKVFAVRRAGAQVALDPDLIERAQIDVMEYTKDHLVKELQDVCRASAVVDIDERDVRFRQRETLDFGYPLLMVRAQWMPTETVVSFVGGPSDGVLMQVTESHIWGPLRIPVRDDGPTMWDPESPVVPVPLTVAVYEMSGWNNTSRHWLYQFRRFT
jgi:hypothetical protein